MSISTVFGFISQFIVAAFIVALALAIIEAWAKPNLKPSSYNRWHNLVKDRYSFITTTIWLAVIIVIAVAVIKSESKRIHADAVACVRDPSTCERPEE